MNTTYMYSTEHKQIEQFTATEPQPHRTVLNYFTKFNNVAHSLEPGETPSDSASPKAPNYAQRSLISQNNSKRFGAVAVRLRLFFQLTYVQNCIIKK